MRCQSNILGNIPISGDCRMASPRAQLPILSFLPVDSQAFTLSVASGIGHKLFLKTAIDWF